MSVRSTVDRDGRRLTVTIDRPAVLNALDTATHAAIARARPLREGGLRATAGTVMPTMQAICLGGGSLVNSAICVRAPDFVLDRWCSDFELAHTRRPQEEL